MKKVVIFLGFLFFFAGASAQISDRIMIDGQIVVPEGDNAEGIAIFNATTNRGTVSTQNGEFTIAVGLGDRLVFSAIQFQDFTVIIDQGILDTKNLQVMVNEAVNPLPEVVVTPYDLSGNVRVDVKRIEVIEPALPAVSADDIQYYEVEHKPDAMTSPQNSAMNTPRLQHGLNFVNIFKAIFSERNQEKTNQRLIDDKIRSLYDDEFFQKYLDIKYENINDFIFYAENHGLSPVLLTKGNELDLIEFLMSQAKRYKVQK